MYNIMLALICLLGTSLHAQIANVRDVPNPRKVNQWAVDNAGVFNSQEKAEIETVLSEIHQRTQAEVALVTLKSIGKKIPKDFAVELFNLWKIGDKVKDNGLLILLVTDQRRIEMETGYGLEGVLPDVTLFRIQQELIVPALKQGRAAAGFLSGLRKIEDVLLGDSSARNFQTDGQSASLFNPGDREGRGALIIIAGIIAFLLLCSFLCMLVLFKNPDPLWRYRQLYKDFRFLFFWQIASFFMPFAWFAYSSGELNALGIGFGLAVLWFIVGNLTRTAWAERLRAQPRECPHCRQTMVLQNNKQEKAFEDPEEIVEEKIGSVDYDVWVCPEGHVRKDSYEGPNAYKYSECEKCHAKANKRISNKVLEQPTTSSEGRGERHFQCLACKSLKRELYAIAAISAVSDSSGSSGYSGSSGSSGGGGGSFGGGSSGGGGSGSSY